MNIHAYLIFDGQCAEAFRFYAEVIGGELQVMDFADSPECGEIPPEHRDRTLHACLNRDGQLLMGSDTMPGQPYEGIKGCHMSLQADDMAQAEHLFQALSAGGQVQMPLQRTFWAEGFAMLTDRFGVPWMVNCSGDCQL
ncbi:VOC family protein [Aquipseudomonas guryensis]|uniref:VOC family protein n=1 Tax=Aquipseudomonas guryensis TaxID=2759165 RepID=A0A7W4DDT3_9GAMM|nr:VOC family protein [Pseudomonas guryensis]MBB1520708.1 VOC family protein [Pseudomonas guryensis]